MPFNTQKANEIHQSKYDYSLVEYKNIDTKVKIICPIHGLFEQTTYHHINRGCGCKQCKGSRISMSKHMGQQWFVDKANLVHNNKYDYSKSVYKNAHTKVIITCSKHGDFIQTPNNHLYINNGCPNCGYNTSRIADEWLKSLGIDSIYKEKVLFINSKKYKVDAYIPETNTIYEYFGYFWHGHPDYFSHDEINPKNKTPFKVLYDNTLQRIKDIQDAGYNLIYVWGK